MKVLLLGDVSGKPGRKVIRELLPGLREEHEIDVVVANVENSAHGIGTSEKIIKELMGYGVDYMTTGEHIWRSNDFEAILSGDYPIIRPTNYPDDLPGQGSIEIDLGADGKILLISLIGSALMQNRYASEPFRAIDKFLSRIDTDKYRNIIVEFHAETTSEKVAMGLYLDGRVSAVVGTHTHVPTADERILDNGTAYITDLGMCGPMNAGLWVKKEIIFQKMKYPYSPRFDIEENGPIRLDGGLIELNADMKATSIKRINKVL